MSIAISGLGNICDEGDGQQIYEADVKLSVTGGEASLQDPR